MWEIDRPLVTTKTATVSLSRREPADDDDEAERIVDALRLPAEQPTAAEAETYLEWLLASLGIPSVSQSGFAASSNQRTRRWRTRSAG
jgi:hypothetical protein